MTLSLHEYSSWDDVLIKNPTLFEQKIQSMRGDDLSIIADFDRTLTKNFVNGNERPSLVSTLRSQHILTEEYSFAAHSLYDFFYPLEIDPDISRTDRAKAMDTWWNAHMQLLSDQMSYVELFRIVGQETIEKRLGQSEHNYTDATKDFWRSHRSSTEIIPAGLTQEAIFQAIESGIIELRGDMSRFFDVLETKNIPLVIFSANALGKDSIEHYLIKQGYHNSVFNIVSNGFVWDTNSGRVTGYHTPVIHTFNKEISAIQKSEAIYTYIKDRRDLILIGDSIGDADMANGFDGDGTMIKIGLLTKKNPTEADKQRYMDIFDIVLVGDGGMEEIVDILEKITPIEKETYNQQ